MVVKGYRPWLDGIRAFSILLVLIEHGARAVMPTWNFGGTGVGIFFVLSGYLITGLLLDERGATGSVRLREFYIRRAARLMPALVLMVVVCDAVFLGLGRHKELLASAISVVYLTNYATVLVGNHLPGFGHTWSLAVEEHFYLVWPPVLLWLGRRLPLPRLLAATLGMCVAVALWRELMQAIGAPPRLLYVGSIERADALLYGCAAAVAVRCGWRPPRGTLCIGLALVAFHLMVTDRLIDLRPILLSVGAALVIVAFDYQPASLLRTTLSWRPVVFLGTISYGIYLWHGTVFHIFKLVELNSALAIGGGLLLSIGLAWLSYRYFEIPIRDAVRKRTAPPELKTPAPAAAT